MVAFNALAKPVRAVGGFYGMALETFVLMFKPPFAWREFILQAWFVARVSIVPTLMLTVALPRCVPTWARGRFARSSMRCV